MSMLVIIIGIVILVTGLFIMMYPENVFGALRTHVNQLSLHIIAIVSRLLIGGLLVFSASASAFPFAIEVIGWLAIIAGFFLLFAGRKVFIRIMWWALSLSAPLKRLAGFFAAAFGMFLIYAFV